MNKEPLAKLQHNAVQSASDARFAPFDEPMMKPHSQGERLQDCKSRRATHCCSIARDSKDTILVQEFLTLREESLETTQGPYKYYSILTKPCSVIIIPFSQDNELLITKEWRHAIHDYVYSFPGGLMDGDETSEEAARRELLEETGCSASSFKVIGSCFTLPGLLTQKMTIVLAENVSKTALPKLDLTENISWEFMCEKSARAFLSTSDHADAMALAALALFDCKNSNHTTLIGSIS